MNQLYSILLAAFILASCSGAKKIQKPQQPVVTDSSIIAEKPVEETETISTVLAKINNINYTTFNGKADLDYTSAKGKKTSAEAKVQIEKGKLIWISAIGPFGIEVARGLITADSVKIINKLSKEYTAASITYLQDKLGLPLDLNTMQDLLVGNPIFLDKNNSSYTKDGSNIAVTSQTRFFQNLITVIMPGYLISQSKLTDVDANRNRSAILQYDDYKPVNNFNFSTSRHIAVDHKGKIDIQLNYKSYTFNQPLSVPFSVPGNYKKVLN